MADQKSSFQLPCVALSLLTPPMVLGQMLGNNLMSLLVDMGKASEEIFRGERLPILKNNN
ncbi:hypothetical protein VKI21_02495 [Cyanobacterium aponinum UTEX 3222]|uniref:Uncharacterized protein n=3 Tax=Cyanobacterium aponinum TaxID=379064 RepID=K9ZAH9_CYAAP|nr:hypothetical protein [Cyanobacterium aponinum]WRL42577.1 hypothetical protein VKI21_02495 [Cyanobacterium aponinum UTEX 3222]AFZ55398.1 hypothetical protein Cyan10605_3356 [Cyanobacterium aponinum PCC 10605]MBD2394365.1 hypothetical protein [Cyanobacterium aponinum FACHB-4101]MTF40130.1 hypothetical protein [Cyanobacterium aponinum 0216]PHV63240.1 hypothetical protein CSQ80_05740 [Cyanobacterium aponinum IPPAS B-1201]